MGILSSRRPSYNLSRHRVYNPREGVLTALTGQKTQGGVDVLLRDSESPQLAVAIEAKRIKVTPGLKGPPSKINKL
jgi:hypothetical protein